MAMRQNEVTRLWKMYESGINYQIKTGLRYNIPKYVDFYEGRQWPTPTESTKNLPRPVVNIVKMICRSKKSSILSSPVKILYKSYSPNTDTDKLNSFAQSILKELNQEGLDRLAIDDGIKKGSYFYHYYWDKDAQSLTGRTEGGVRCEIIDPLNIFFSNPRELDEQKQKWILISTPMELSKVHSLCDSDVNLTLIEPDESPEQKDTATLLTCYFKIDGEVWCERATKYCTVNKPFRLTPDITALEAFLTPPPTNTHNQTKLNPINTAKPVGTGVPDRPPNGTHNQTKLNPINTAKPVGTGVPDRPSNGTHNQTELNPINTAKPVGTGVPDRPSINTPKSTPLSYLKHITTAHRPRATLYPIVCGYYERKEGSIYGISEVEGIIPNQKAINFNIAMTLLNSQQCAWGKYIALPNALKGQVITNSPGQVLIDYSGTGEGIKRMSDEGISQIPMSIVQELTELTRTATGSSEILSGEALSTNMSGVAIAQLQAQAEVPIEELRSTFWDVKRKQGLVLAQFIRLYYYDREFIRSVRDKHGKECEICDRFFSSEYENSIFDIVVEPTKGTKATVASDVSMLDTCLKNGSISFETYIKSYPEGAISNKSTILKQIEEEKSSEIQRLRKEIELLKNGKTLDPVSII